MISSLQLFAFVCFFATVLSFTYSGDDLRVVKTDAGFISGILNEGGDIHIFKGIPFAAPPLGDLRWKPPQAVSAWQGVRECKVFGPSPMQGKPVPFSMWTQEFLIPKEPISEDCLYLNVWSGAKSSKERRPVIVWIYGGGFISGGSAVPIYDGEAMAKKGIVFVSINYRVGIFGFLAHPELTKESANNASGNYGLMDQIAALKWVQNNIREFGGDPHNVTIAGQSAGSMSVNCLVASPLAKNLFQKAIAQSGASFTNGNPGLNEAEEGGMRIMKSLNASSIGDMRKMPVENFTKSTYFLSPVVDGFVLPEPIVNIFTQGKENKVGLLTGWNEDEGLLFGPAKNAESFKKEAEKNYGPDAQTFLRFYPAANEEQAASSELKVSRDQIFGVQNYTWANIQSNRSSKVYVYRFARKVPATGEYVKYGAFHSGELPYAYDNLKFVDRPWEQADHQLATIMSSYWANFVKTGDPNGKNLPLWEAYNSKDKKIMILDINPHTAQLPDAAALDFLYNEALKK